MFNGLSIVNWTDKRASESLVLAAQRLSMGENRAVIGYKLTGSYIKSERTVLKYL
jgi:hypothetical protein